MVLDPVPDKEGDVTQPLLVIDGDSYVERAPSRLLAHSRRRIDGAALIGELRQRVDTEPSECVMAYISPSASPR